MKAATLFIIKCAVLAVTQGQVFQNDQQRWVVPHRIHNAMCSGMMDGMIFHDPDSCDAYVQCQRGTVTRMKCPQGMLFDLSLLYCVAARSVNCGTRGHAGMVAPTMPNYPERPPSQESHHSVCRNMRNGALFANPTNCRAYIECQQNLRLDRDCQQGELFDAHSRVCMSAFTVDCGNRAISPAIDDATIRNICVGQQNGARIPDPRDCRRYFECRNQQALPLECNLGDLFEMTLRACIFDGAVNCAGRNRNSNDQLPSPLEPDGSISRFICSGMPAGTRISDPRNCQAYYECRQNQRIDLTCATGMSFDLNMSQCRPTSVVNCGTRSARSDLPQNAICQGQRNGRRISNPVNCRAYIECQNNGRIDRTCEIGLLFDTQIESCLPAHTVRCGTRNLPPTDITPQSPEDFFPSCPRTGHSFRAHPHDCQSYFICAAGVLIQHYCAPGIHFNPDTLQCDFQQNARCRSNRIVSPQMPLLPNCSEDDQLYFPNLVNCTQFYFCVNNSPQLMNCPDDYIWNNRKLKCEVSESEVCARGFDAKAKIFSYTAPKANERKRKP